MCRLNNVKDFYCEHSNYHIVKMGYIRRESPIWKRVRLVHSLKVLELEGTVHPLPSPTGNWKAVLFWGTRHSSSTTNAIMKVVPGVVVVPSAIAISNRAYQREQKLVKMKEMEMDRSFCRVSFVPFLSMEVSCFMGQSICSSLSLSLFYIVLEDEKLSIWYKFS